MKTITQTVALTDLRFYAYHGYYPEEQVLGNNFVVDVQATFPKEGGAGDDLAHTVDYQELYEIVRTEMQQPRKLLETVAEAILERTQARFPFVTAIRARICKCRPPFGGDLARASVVLDWMA